MIVIKKFEESDIHRVILFEKELRKEEPNTYFWNPDNLYEKSLKESFHDTRFSGALSYIALKDNRVIGRIDASIISSRSDAICNTVYLDWICVLKSERHNKIAQSLLSALRKECAKLGAGVIVALMANNPEVQKFYKNIPNTSIHDTGIWINV